MKQVQLEQDEWDRLLYLADLAVSEILSDMYDPEDDSNEDPMVDALDLLDKVRKQVT